MPETPPLAAPGSPDELLVRRIDHDRLPRHVAIIMDGNGRWAQTRDLPRVEGHRAGVEAVRDTLEASAALGLEALTLYAFSVENWKRPRYEVWTLMNLLKDYLRREQDTLVKHNVRFHVLGRWRDLEPAVVRGLERAIDASKDCTGMTFNLALNYSGRCEIVDACRQIVADWARGERTDIDEETLGRHLYTAGQPDPDLLIRTSGEMRVSNFLLWQLAYTELWITPTLWPDFRRRDLFEGILAYQERERRYGSLGDEAQESAGRLPSA